MSVFKVLGKNIHILILKFTQRFVKITNVWLFKHKSSAKDLSLEIKCIEHVGGLKINQKNCWNFLQ